MVSGIRWPSSRPDDVVPASEFERAAVEAGAPEGTKLQDAHTLDPAHAVQIPGLLEETTRKRWTELMRVTPNSTFLTFLSLLFFFF